MPSTRRNSSKVAAQSGKSPCPLQETPTIERLEDRRLLSVIATALPFHPQSTPGVAIEMAGEQQHAPASKSLPSARIAMAVESAVSASVRRVSEALGTKDAIGNAIGKATGKAIVPRALEAIRAVTGSKPPAPTLGDQGDRPAAGASRSLSSKDQIASATFAASGTQLIVEPDNVSGLSATSATISWAPATTIYLSGAEEVPTGNYQVTVNARTYAVAGTSVYVTGLRPATTYAYSVSAQYDVTTQTSPPTQPPAPPPPTQPPPPPNSPPPPPPPPYSPPPPPPSPPPPSPPPPSPPPPPPYSPPPSPPPPYSPPPPPPPSPPPPSPPYSPPASPPSSPNSPPSPPPASPAAMASPSVRAAMGAAADASQQTSGLRPFIDLRQAATVNTTNAIEVDTTDSEPAVAALDSSEVEYLPYTSGQFTTGAVSITGPDGLTASAVGETSASIQWNAASDNAYSITGYDVQYRPDGSSNWVSDGTTSATATSLGGLTPGASYDVEVDAIDSAGNAGNWTQATNLFTTASLPAPTLTTPADGAIGQSTTPTFAWGSVTGAAGGYNILVDTNASDLPTSPAGAAGPTAVLSDHLAATSYTPTIALQNGTTYYWEVQGVGSGAIPGQWSGIGSFMPGGLTAPTLASPANSSNGLSATPIFGWNAVPGAAGGYNIIVDANASDLPTTPAGAAGPTAVFSGHTVTTSDTPTSALQPSTTYSWEVQAVGSPGVEGPWSTVGSFTTSGPRITVLPNDQAIQSGQGAAIPADAVDFPSLVRGGASAPETFTIENTGTTVLTLGRLRIPQGFTVVSQPPKSLAPGHVGVFKLRLKTTELGTFGGTASFTDNDAAAGQDPFTFAITGTVVPKPAPALSILGNGQPIQPDRALASAINGTDFGSVDQASAAVLSTFTIENTGNAVLKLGNIRVPRGFSVAAEPPRSIAPGDSATFILRLNTERPGAFTGFVSFATNDPQPGEHPFTFAVRGIVIAGTPGLIVSGNGQAIVPGQ